MESLNQLSVPGHAWHSVEFSITSYYKQEELSGSLQIRLVIHQFVARVSSNIVCSHIFQQGYTSLVLLRRTLQCLLLLRLTYRGEACGLWTTLASPPL